MHRYEIKKLWNLCYEMSVSPANAKNRRKQEEAEDKELSASMIQCEIKVAKDVESTANAK